MNGLQESLRKPFYDSIYKTSVYTRSRRMLHLGVEKFK